MTVVIDASVVVAALVDVGPDGIWAEAILASEPLAAPHLMLVEVANILRRAALTGAISEATAGHAHDDLLALRVVLFPYAPLAPRAWELQSNVTIYDGCYVALAEALASPLATLDKKLARAPGPRCRFRTR